MIEIGLLYCAKIRLKQLLEAANGCHEDQVQIFEGVQRLVDPDGMGGLYKVLALRCNGKNVSLNADEMPLGFV